MKKKKVKKPLRLTEFLNELGERVEPAQVERRPTKFSSNLRREAGIVFVTDPHGLTLEELKTDPRFKPVSMGLLRHWCAVDKWVERRKEIFDRWKKEVEDRLGSELAKARVSEIRELHNVRRLALEKLYSIDTPTKSWEGVVKALLEVNARLEDLATNVGKEMLPAATARIGSSAAMRTELSIDEIRAATKEVLRLRREALRLEMETEKEAKEKKKHG
jgi:hypothetical protein